MSEMMGVTARVRVRPEWVGADWREKMPPPLVDLLNELEYWDVDGPEAETVTAYGDINYGFSSVSDEMEELRAGLQEHGIAFVGHTEAKYEYDGDVLWWTPDGGHGHRPADQGGGAMLGRMEYEALVKQHVTDRDEGVDFIDRLIDLRHALDAFFVNPWELLDKAPLPPIYEPEEP